jgi:phosphoribosylamine--glycine ligase
MNAPAHILIIGGGAREHALAWRLAADEGVVAVYVAPGNDGMRDVATTHPNVAPADHEAVVALARAVAADLVVVGPEAPLATGLADRLLAEEIPVFGPTRAATALESSKAFCRSVAEAAGIPMAEGASFEHAGRALVYARALGAPLVVKADGLAAGKGVVVCESATDAEVAIRAALEGGIFGEAGRRIVVERRLAGREASLMAVCDGKRALPLPPVRDHKRVGDGDTGPNTGGMGAYSPLADVADDAAERFADVFLRPALVEMARRGRPFRGLLYAGLMLTDDGPRLLEFNARFGDPEAQAVLPRLDGPLAALLHAAAGGDLGALDEPAPSGATAIAASPLAVVAVVLAAAGYPATPRTGDLVEGIADARAGGALVFHGATTLRDGRTLTAGGRVLTVVGRGDDVADARERAYAAADRIRFAGMHRRADIGRPLSVMAGVAA